MPRQFSMTSQPEACEATGNPVHGNPRSFARGEESGTDGFRGDRRRTHGMREVPACCHDQRPFSESGGRGMNPHPEPIGAIPATWNSCPDPARGTRHQHPRSACPHFPCPGRLGRVRKRCILWFPRQKPAHASDPRQTQGAGSKHSDSKGRPDMDFFGALACRIPHRILQMESFFGKGSNNRIKKRLSRSLPSLMFFPLCL